MHATVPPGIQSLVDMMNSPAGQGLLIVWAFIVLAVILWLIPDWINALARRQSPNDKAAEKAAQVAVPKLQRFGIRR